MAADGSSWVEPANLIANLSIDSRLKGIRSTLERQHSDHQLDQMIAQQRRERERVRELQERKQVRALMQQVVDARSLLTNEAALTDLSSGARWRTYREALSILRGIDPTDFESIQDMNFLKETEIGLEAASKAARKDFPDHAIYELLWMAQARARQLANLYVVSQFENALTKASTVPEPGRPVWQWIALGGVGLLGLLVFTFLAIPVIAIAAWFMWRKGNSGQLGKFRIEQTRRELQAVAPIQELFGADLLSESAIKLEPPTATTLNNLKRSIGTLRKEIESALDAAAQSERYLNGDYGAELGAFAGGPKPFNSADADNVLAAWEGEVDRREQVRDYLLARYNNLADLKPA